VFFEGYSFFKVFVETTRNTRVYSKFISNTDTGSCHVGNRRILLAKNIAYQDPAWRRKLAKHCRLCHDTNRFTKPVNTIVLRFRDGASWNLILFVKLKGSDSQCPAIKNSFALTFYHQICLWQENIPTRKLRIRVYTEVLQFSKDHFLVNHHVENRVRVGLRLGLRVGKTGHLLNIYCVTIAIIES